MGQVLVDFWVSNCRSSQQMKELKGINPEVCKGKACRIDKTRLEKDRKLKPRSVR